LLFGAYLASTRLSRSSLEGMLALENALGDTAGGAAVGLIAMLTLFGLLAVRGQITGVDRGTAAFALSNAAAVYAAAAFEELIFRGVLFAFIDRALGTFAALLVSSTLFVIAHHDNAGLELAAVAVIFVGGSALAFGVLLTGTLWASIAAHAAWNFALGPLMGASLSGHHTRSILVVRFAESSTGAGGAFGPENTVPAVVLVTLLAGVLGARARAQGRWTPLRLRWKAATPAMDRPELSREG
jgi:membrane protease YdiL (CAAX protease family)